MAEFKISRIRFTWQGDWAAGTAYTKDDIVRYDSKVFVCLVGHTADLDFYEDLNYVDETVTPSVPDPKWELMFEGQAWVGNWAPETYYSIGEIVKDGGQVYICTLGHTSRDNLAQDSTSWTYFARTEDWRTDWTVDTYYELFAIVKYGGIVYRCIDPHLSAGTIDEGLEADIAKWTIVGLTHDWKTDWATETRYKRNDVVKYGATVYRCTEGHTSATSVDDGIEVDSDKWEIIHRGIEYKFDWDPDTFKYKVNDIVKYGANLYICTTAHVSSEEFDESKWIFFIPGLQYEEDWLSLETYQPGDVVKYGGYSYYSKTLNTNKVPSVESADWELLTIGYKMQSTDWNSAQQYYVGDVVRRQGQLYVAREDNSAKDPNISSEWELQIPGEKYVGNWFPEQSYAIGDIVTYRENTYRCITLHESEDANRPDNDIAKNLTLNVGEYWALLIEGDHNNRLEYQGDIKTYDVIEDSSAVPSRLPIGNDGEVLRVVDSQVSWEKFGVVNKVYYVATDGVDEITRGTTLNDPWRTVKYACQNITGPATIFIKTGVYKEEIPISIPADVALVGDELRSTVIEPAANFETRDMFYVRNGTGIRNMTLRGLSGTLGPRNAFGTQRPTAGAFVSLDPGSSPFDENVWISTRSPYIQNVTTFGTGCTGLKVDGSLHTGGNRSIVANDFTQILSDGIGAWVTNNGLSELVSVFSYYGHIGYLAEDGGKIRATNGNSSYGTYGCVAEGYNLTEEPITATVNNRTLEAQVGEIFAGQQGDKILVLGYAHAGQNYTGATYTVSGAGYGADLKATEFRDRSIFEARILGPGDSSAAGGGGFISTGNNAQAGDTTTVTIASNDQNTEAEYLGLRVTLTSGTGVGQYGYVYAYDDVSKVATIYKESDDTPGWDHVVGGYPIEPVLDSTTVYRLEARLTFSAPSFSITSSNLPASQTWTSVVYGNSRFVAVSSNSASTAYSTDGSTWSAGGDLPAGSGWNCMAFTGTRFVTLQTGTDVAAYSTNGSSWTSITLPYSASWSAMAYGEGTLVALKTGTTNTGIYSLDNGNTWSNMTLPYTIDWRCVTYGNGLFVAISDYGAAYSEDGITWNLSTTILPTHTWSSITFGNNKFMAVASDNTNEYVYSFDGDTWYTQTFPASSSWKAVGYGQGVYMAVSFSGNAVSSEDGVQWTNRSLTPAGSHNAIGFGNPGNVGKFVVVTDGQTSYQVVGGCRAKGKPVITAGRIGEIFLWEPGSGYTTTPTLTFTDPNLTSLPQVDCRTGNGVLGQPSFVNRGNGYQTTSTTVTIAGDGYADIYQLGKYLYVENLTRYPAPGANLVIDEINDVIYKIVGIQQLGGTAPNYRARFQIAPIFDRNESPAHGTEMTIREKYSQVRLTGHDFLEIGTGNYEQTSYPETNLINVAPENEVVYKGGGRVFYTSTDQDGNFRVGELFKVEQSTGIVSVSADYFELSGLEELRLGGVQVGGSGTVIREFSTDATFTADSNNIVPTQRAIKNYIARRISGGGSDASTGQLTAGTVKLGFQSISSTTNTEVKMRNKVMMKSGFGGTMLAMYMFSDAFGNDSNYGSQ